MRMVRRDAQSDATARAALAMVERHGGMAYARAAKEDLEALPDGAARLVEYNMGRRV